MLRLIY